MTDALGAGDYEGALKKLQVLLPDAAGAHFHPGGGGRSPARISAARILIDAGKGGDELMKICGLKDYAARKTMGTAKRFLPGSAVRRRIWCWRRIPS